MNKRKPTRSQGNFVQVRRGLQQHLEDGRLTIREHSCLVSMILWAQADTGIWQGCAIKVAARYGCGELGLQGAQRVLASLEEKGYVQRIRSHGQRHDYPIVINGYEVTMGAHKGKRVFAMSSKAEDTQYCDPGIAPTPLLTEGVHEGVTDGVGEGVSNGGAKGAAATYTISDNNIGVPPIVATRSISPRSINPVELASLQAERDKPDKTGWIGSDSQPDAFAEARQGIHIPQPTSAPLPEISAGPTKPISAEAEDLAYFCRTNLKKPPSPVDLERAENLLEEYSLSHLKAVWSWAREHEFWRDRTYNLANFATQLMEGALGEQYKTATDSSERATSEEQDAGANPDLFYNMPR